MPIKEKVKNGQKINGAEFPLVYSENDFCFQLLADMVDDKNLAMGLVYPPLSRILQVSTDLAIGLMKFAYKHQLAYHYPEPEEKRKFVESYQYDMTYKSFEPATYDWPDGLNSTECKI